MGDARAKLDTDAHGSRAGRGRHGRRPTALRAARDPLVGLGAPHVDDAGLAAGWAAWPAGPASKPGCGRPSWPRHARQQAAAAEQAQGAAGRVQQGRANLARLREDAKSAAQADQEARTQLSQLTERIAELDRLLQDAPDEKQVIEQLAAARPA